MEGVDQIPEGCILLGDADLPAVQEGDHVGADQAAHMACSLRGAQVATVGEGGQQVALDRIVELGLRAREGPEVPGPRRPVMHVGEDVEEAALGDALEERCLQGLGRV
jgi:hypothetical protein